jgi:hypothetical protein
MCAFNTILDCLFIENKTEQNQNTDVGIKLFGGYYVVLSYYVVYNKFI